VVTVGVVGSSLLLVAVGVMIVHFVLLLWALSPIIAKTANSKQNN
jgi:hypothetical protein